MKRFVNGLVASLVLCGLLTWFVGPSARAQTPAAPPPPAVPEVKVMSAPKPPAEQCDTMKVNTLAADRFVVVKDLGDHQLIIVYTVDDKGKVYQADKKMFYY